jgi:endonuclease YncB( thermonuclease family)
MAVRRGYQFLINCRDKDAMKRKSKLPPEWAVYTAKNPKRPRRSSGFPAWSYAATGLGMGSLIGLAIFFWPTGSEAVQSGQAAFSSGSAIQRAFTLCHTGGGTNCVVDGDTIWLNGTKIRVADIDAPETHPPRCEREADLGNQATQRLLQLVNEGGFSAEAFGGRDEDRYGRKLRVLVRGGRSLGDQLVSEGLARTWDGARRPWC